MIEIYLGDNGEIQERNMERISWDARWQMEQAVKEAEKRQKEEKKKRALIRNTVLRAITLFWIVVTIAAIYLLTTEHWIRGIVYLLCGTTWLTAYAYANGDRILAVLLQPIKKPEREKFKDILKTWGEKKEKTP